MYSVWLWNRTVTIVAEAVPLCEDRAVQGKVRTVYDGRFSVRCYATDFQVDGRACLPHQLVLACSVSSFFTCPFRLFVF